ncbi:hypothetical protein GW17_00035990 [Ensete ventricosum]|nr:hypothetical protein GW17_00035990 [Ensete ventricosum]
MAEELIWFGFSHVCKFVNVDHNWGVRLSSGLRLENLNLRSVTWAPLPQVHSEVLYEGLVGVGVPDVTLSTLNFCCRGGQVITLPPQLGPAPAGLTSDLMDS